MKLYIVTGSFDNVMLQRVLHTHTHTGIVSYTLCLNACLISLFDWVAICNDLQCVHDYFNKVV